MLSEVFIFSFLLLKIAESAVRSTVVRARGKQLLKLYAKWPA